MVTGHSVTDQEESERRRVTERDPGLSRKGRGTENVGGTFSAPRVAFLQPGGFSSRAQPSLAPRSTPLLLPLTDGQGLRKQWDSY